MLHYLLAAEENAEIFGAKKVWASVSFTFQVPMPLTLLVHMNSTFTVHSKQYVCSIIYIIKDS